jgi:O-antigen ligase
VLIKFDAVLKRMSFGLLCLMPLLLAVSRAGADIALSLVAVSFLLHSMIHRRKDWLKRHEIWAMLLLWIYLSLQSLLMSDQATFLRSLAWLRFIMFYASVVCWLATTSQAISWIAKITAMTAALLIIDTYWQYFHGISLSGQPYPHENRLGGPMTHPNIANLLLKVCLPVAGIWAWWVVARGALHIKLFADGAALVLFALVLISGERSSSLLMLLACALIAAGLFFHDRRLRAHVILASGLLLLVIIALIATQDVVHMRATHLINQLAHLSESVYGQLYIAAFHFWYENPVFGLGAGQFKYQCEAVMPLLHTTYCDVHPHNIYLEWLSETGTVGAALFITAMGLVVKSLWHKRHSTPPLLWYLPMVALAVVLWPAIVTQSIFSNWPAMLFWYSLSIAAASPSFAKRHVH